MPKRPPVQIPDAIDKAITAFEDAVTEWCDDSQHAAGYELVHQEKKINQRRAQLVRLIAAAVKNAKGN